MRWSWRRLPTLHGRSESSVFADTEDTRLGRGIAPSTAAHAELSGIYPLLDAHDAFAARILLARAADRSLDIQYYIWNADLSGTLLFEALHEAAERGVRVRLLLDDNNTYGLDTLLAALDAHPNIEVRLFNPFMQRHWRVLGYLINPLRLNRRMHNKSFTADNQVTLIGGRNIGDEYFAARDGSLFVDLDVLAVGPVVREVSEDFDRYWACASSYPAAAILPRVEQNAAIAGTTSPTDSPIDPLIERDSKTRSYIDAVQQSPFVHQLLSGTLPLTWAPVRMVSDDPAKGLGLAPQSKLLSHALRRIIDEPHQELSLVSGYFVPTSAGVGLFTAMARRGIRVRILTNALEATDVSIVHAGYAKYRKPLLEAGISLHEIRRQARGDIRERKRLRDHGMVLRHSGSTLHAKTFIIDSERVFIGSFNFDPRSFNLNTEMGFLIHDAELATQIENAFKSLVPTSAYELGLSARGELYWIAREDNQYQRHDTEPGTTWPRRALVRLLSWLPIEWLL
ncbi:MAG: phospholipase D family protein [Chromatiales bacterium]|nr:phospholipase D family protein [Chromatiales bacterium]